YLSPFFYCFPIVLSILLFLPLFFFNAPSTTDIYTLSLHDALPISQRSALDLDMEIAVFVHAQSVARGQHRDAVGPFDDRRPPNLDRKSTRLNSSHSQISYAVFCLKKKNKHRT